MAKPNQKLDKNGKPVTGYAAFVAQEWSEINKTRTEKVTQKKFIAISKVSSRNHNYSFKNFNKFVSHPFFVVYMNLVYMHLTLQMNHMI